MLVLLIPVGMVCFKVQYHTIQDWWTDTRLLRIQACSM